MYRTTQLSCLLLLSLCSTLFGQATAVISGPTTGSPGDLVVLYTTGSIGDNFIWITPSNVQTLTCDKDKQIAFATGTAGKYKFTLISADKDANISYAEHTVTIGTPTNPSPPETGPAPTPTPAPPLNSLFELSKTNKPQDPDTSKQLVANIESATLVINDMCSRQKCPTVDEAARIYQANIQHAIALRPRGSQTNWVPWREALDVELEKLNPSDLDTIKLAYTEIAKGLR